MVPCFNTQPRGDGWFIKFKHLNLNTGFNTQPPEGGCAISCALPRSPLAFQHTATRRRLPLEEVRGVLLHPFQHTAARRRLPDLTRPGRGRKRFQHTAARRRLLYSCVAEKCPTVVSTHSRAEAAALALLARAFFLRCFNTQLRGGGCSFNQILSGVPKRFNTQPRGGGCGSISTHPAGIKCFNTQPRGGGCQSHTRNR